MSVDILHDYEARILGLHGQAGEREFNALADQLLRLDTESNDEITIYFSSQGGNLVDALKIIDVLETLRSAVRGIGMGLIQNAGAVILAATQKPMMLPSAILFPAGLWDLPSHRTTIGLHTSDDPSLQILLQRRLDVLASRYPQVISLIRTAEKRPRFINSSEAKHLGLIHQIITHPSIHLQKVKHHVL